MRTRLGQEVRKTVTILFCDVVRSTSLAGEVDPETLREVMSRYFAEMQAVLEGHGGTVEKFSGDDVMAVFGVPAAHEDDALRAVRAASAMLERLEELNEELAAAWGLRLQVRVGVNTGEVVAGNPSSGQTFVTGEPVNVAKRLEQSAKPGEILLGDETSRLVRHAVVMTVAGPFQVKGKRDEITVWRLEEVDTESEALPRRFDAPLVGRAAELVALRTAYTRAVKTGRPQLVTVLGLAGIGKSRLARELFDGVADEAGVLIGRCLPYGEGITFWPVREILPDETFEGTTEAIFWRIRTGLQEIADVRPLVVCFEDVHWGEPTFLDLVQYLAGWMREAPVLILCLARPDLFERRPDWPTSGADALTLRLGPLSDQDAAAMLDHLQASGEIRGRIAEAAEGNPLFVEQMAAMAAEDGSDVAVPPSIRALLTARLDRLDSSETAVIERAAVIGREFPLRAVVDLAPPELQHEVSARLLGLVRKELIRPYAVGEDDRFRFRHALIRDAAYEAMPKGLRAELHERHAAWLDASGHRDLIVGYHLEQAVRLRRELAPHDESTAGLAARAGGLLGEAGRRAFRRGDMPAARSLLGRAVDLLPEHGALRLDLRRLEANALWTLGEIDRADELLLEVVDAASACGDHRTEWAARLDRSQRLMMGGRPGGGDLVDTATRAAEVFEQLGEEAGLARAHRALGLAAYRLGHYESAERELRRALDHADRARDETETARSADALCTALLFGPAETEGAATLCRELLDRSTGNLLLEANVATSLSGLEAMRGRFDEARSLYGRGRAIYQDLGLRMTLAGLTQVSGLVELLAGEPEAAERELREGHEILAAAGAKLFIAPQSALLAAALLALGRAAEADALVREAEALLGPEDLASQILVKTVRAHVDLACREPEAALTGARQAVHVGEKTDALSLTGDAFVALALAHARCGNRREAEAAIARALSLYERKGNVAAARRASNLLVEVVA